MRSVYVVATILATTALAGLSARQRPASISGVITDTSGGGLPGARIKIVSEGAPRATVTDSAGRYHLDVATPGRYSVEASMAGFDGRETVIDVLPGADVTWSGALLVGPAFGEPSIERQVMRLTGPAAIDCGRYAGPASEAALRDSLACARTSVRMRRSFAVIEQAADANTRQYRGLAAGPDGVIHVFRQERGGRLRLEQCPSPHVTRRRNPLRDGFEFTCQAPGEPAFKRANRARP